MRFHKGLHHLQELLFNFVLFLMYSLYFVEWLGFSKTATTYLTMLDNIIKMYVSLFLIFRFNPLRHTRFTNFDRRVVFTCALYVIATTTINTIIKTYYKRAVHKVATSNFSDDGIINAF